MIQYTFRIGDCSIRFQTSVKQEIEEQFHPFVIEGEGQSNICFLPVEQIDEIVGEDLVTEEDAMYSEYLVNGAYIRTFHGTGTKEPYAVLRKAGEHEWKCSYLKSYEKYFKRIGNCFGHIAMERILMEQEAAILHASFIEYEGQAVLFTGPSGIGKSTQAGLWEQYEDAQILNGDRTILRKKKESGMHMVRRMRVHPEYIGTNVFQSEQLFH